jgi:hypothetical protein
MEKLALDVQRRNTDLFSMQLTVSRQSDRRKTR